MRRLDDLGTGAVLALVTQSGRGKGSGASVDSSLAALYTVLDAKIVRITMFQGEKEALEAAGLSEENVDAIRAVYERWGEGDFEAGLDLLDPHAVLVHDPEFEAGGPSYGINAITEFTRGMLEAWTRFTISAEEVIPARDSVLVGVHQRGVGRASGVPADLHYFMVWTFRGHKVVRFESIRVRAKALEAAGLSE